MAEAIRLYMDEHVPSAVTLALRRRGIDVLTAQDAGMVQAPDAQHLAFAMQQGRVVVTQDADFLRLHAAGVGHAGIAYARQGTSTQYMTQVLTLLVTVLSPAEMVNHVEFL